KRGADAPLAVTAIFGAVGAIDCATAGSDSRVEDVVRGGLGSSWRRGSVLPACAGGKYGAASPRRAETPPYYIFNAAVGSGGGAINRSDGPEDRGHGERCISAALPDFGGFRRIVQSPGQISMLYDVGQGQGWMRVIPITNAPHLPSAVRLWWGDSRARW